MATSLKEWVESDVLNARKKPMRWRSERFFFRDPARPIYTDSNFIFAPADGVILYQQVVGVNEPLLEIKGKTYSICEATRGRCQGDRYLVIGTFMTVYDVHVNRAPYGGTLHYEILPTIETFNRPMLAVEEALLHGRCLPVDDAEYLFSNQRVLNRVFAPNLDLAYYMLQIADYDVESIMPFDQRQGIHIAQNQRFSQVRFGSQVDLIIPIVEHLDFEVLLPTNVHIEAGVDPLVRIAFK